MKPTSVLCFLLLSLGGCKQNDVLPGAYLRPLYLGIEPLRDGALLKWTPVRHFEEHGPDNSVSPARYEIYVSESTEKELRRVAIIDGAVREYVVQNQPEGKMIYAQVRAIHPKLPGSESNVVTTNTGQLGISEVLFSVNTPYISYGAWGGSGLVYAGADGLSVRRSDGSVRKLKSAGSLPVLSPDGQYVAFVGSRDSATRNITQLLVETVESGVVRLIDTQRDIFSVEWSNDGRKLAYVALGEKQSSRSVWKRSLTEDKSTLVYTPAGGSDQLGDGRIDWSPDDAFIVVTQGKPETSLSRYVTNLIRIPVDGSSPQTLLASGWFDEQPAFSPDGQRLAFVSNRSGHRAIWVLKLSNYTLQQVTGNEEELQYYSYYFNRLDWMSNTQLTYSGRVSQPPNVILKKVILQ
ncbi:TolB family protein [Spirosoma arcticum]